MDTAANPTDEASYQAVRADERLWQWAKELRVSRRRLLQLLTMGTSSAFLQSRASWRPRGVQAASPEDLVLKPTPPELFFDYGSNQETRWEEIYPDGYVVPDALFWARPLELGHTHPSLLLASLLSARTRRRHLA